MPTYEQIPKACPVCNGKIFIDLETYVICQIGCGFTGVIYSPIYNYSYIQFNWKNLGSCNFDFVQNKINIYIWHTKTKKSIVIERPLDLDFNLYHEWKDEILNIIKKYRKFL